MDESPTPVLVVPPIGEAPTQDREITLPDVDETPMLDEAFVLDLMQEDTF